MLTIVTLARVLVAVALALARVLVAVRASLLLELNLEHKGLHNERYDHL